MLQLEKEQKTQLTRTAQVQHELDQMKELLRTIAAKVDALTKR